MSQNPLVSSCNNKQSCWIRAWKLCRILKGLSGSFRILKDLEGSWRLLKDCEGSWRVLNGLEWSWMILNDLAGPWLGQIWDGVLQDLEGSWRIFWGSWVLQDLEWRFRILKVFVGSWRIAKFLTGALILKSVTDRLSEWMCDRARSREASASKTPLIVDT